jgi:hypothetical protein
MTINALCEKWQRHEKRIEVLSVRVSERTISELQTIAEKYKVSTAAVSHDFLLLGLAMYEKENSLVDRVPA